MCFVKDKIWKHNGLEDKIWKHVAWCLGSMPRPDG